MLKCVIGLSHAPRTTQTQAWQTSRHFDVHSPPHSTAPLMFHTHTLPTPLPPTLSSVLHLSPSTPLMNNWSIRYAGDSVGNHVNVHYRHWMNNGITPPQFILFRCEGTQQSTIDVLSDKEGSGVLLQVARAKWSNKTIPLTIDCGRLLTVHVAAPSRENIR